MKERRLDNPIVVPGLLSFLAYGTFHAEVHGLDEFPEDTWPDNIELLYYAFHIMVGLGTLFILLMGSPRCFAWRGALLAQPRRCFWMLMLAFPFPYIATTAGWMTAELGRQPWLVYGLMRTRRARARRVHSGTVLFTLIGFSGLYFVLGVLFLFLIGREIAHGPVPLDGHGAEARPPRVGRCPLVELWFAIASVMLTVYVVLDGFDLGAGALHLFVARTDGSAGRCSPRSGRSGTATRSGCSPRAACCSSRSRRCSPRGCRASTSRSSSCSGRSSCAASRSSSAATSRPALASGVGLRLLLSAARCCRCCSAPRSATCCAACRSTATD